MDENYTVLVVDDEKVIRDGCIRFLEPEGFRVTTAANGREALDLLETEPVNVVLCDLKMPVMGALEVLEITGTRYPDVPVIIITGHGTVADAVECMKQGAYDFVTKPFRIDHLVLVVRRALDKQVLERQARDLQEEQARNLYSLALEQSRLRTIINCMGDGVLVTNRDMEVVLYNPALSQHLGLSNPASLPGPLSNYFDDAALRESIESLLQDAGEDPDRRIAQELTRGKTQLRALSAPFFGPDEHVLGTVTVFHDISSFKEVEEMKNDFVHMVSHELRSPLTAIKLQHKVILDGLAGELTEKQRHLIERAHDKIDGLIELINDLLDVSKIEAGHGRMEQVPLNLHEVIAEVTGLLDARATSLRIRLVLEQPTAPTVIRADRRGMEELFTNLLTNAINYSPDGGEVRAEIIPHGNYVEIRVSDTGIGIEETEIPKIFDKFYRVKDPSTRQVIGSGLGLAIVKGIVEAHQGSIEVESRKGAGTTFKVLLPVVPETEDCLVGEA